MKHSLNFSTNYNCYLNDYMDIIRAFGGYFELQENGIQVFLDLQKNINDKINYEVRLKSELFNQNFINKFNLEYSIDNCMMYDYKVLGECSKYDDLVDKEFGFIYAQFSLDTDSSNLKQKSIEKRLSKVVLYLALSCLSSVKLPYGSLTGIRPTKLYKELLLHNINAFDYFTNILQVSFEKTQLIDQIVDKQSNFFNTDDMQVDLFINIPICSSRCSYCSFISAEYSKIKKHIKPYCDLLIQEIEHSKKLILDNGFSLRSVYIGGGTPTSLDTENFERVLSHCDFDCIEFTVEAGRPDTISKEKLDIMAKYNVTRISINPQTFNQNTLNCIGRNHSVEQIYEIFELAKNYNFDINMDLIAMLPNENLEDFCKSVDSAISLAPDNITVHTLALKRGSKLTENGYDNFDQNLPQHMIDYSYQALTKAGYFPYYMYKQKYMSGNLENVGYCKQGKECVYNIDIMEETTTIIANGAGGISKAINHGQNRLERLANPKGIDVYLSRKLSICQSKQEFFDNFIKELKI